MQGSITTPRRASGRPRRFEEATEIRLILEAGTAVMRRNAYAAATVQDVLDEAGLSTRAFYRHFQSKDDLVKAIYRRDAERAATRITERVAASDSPRGALEEWIDELLGFGFDGRRAERVAMIRSEIGRKATGYRDEEKYAQELITRPLVATLTAGRDDGSFPATDPEADALTIYAMTCEIWQWGLDGRFRISRRAALEHVLRFCLPAVGWVTA
jgi:AcrR family transcriptional regulator